MATDILSGLVLQASADAFSGSFDAVVDVLGQPEIWLGAFAGGAFGAALGALPAFAITGLLVVAGSAAGTLGVAPGNVGLVGIGFGHVFGPHISFAGGAAAAAYAAKKGKIGEEGGYHNGKDIGFALGTAPDVLAVGGAFGLLGIAVEQTFRNLAVPVDPIPVAICVSAFAHRAVFGYALIGKVRGDGLFDMGPFERDQTVGATDGGKTVTDGGTVENAGTPESEWLATEPWLPHMYKWPNVMMIGLVAGLASGYVAWRTGSPFLGFGVSAASLLFLNLGVERIPATHHMTLAGSTVFLALHPGQWANFANTTGSAVALVAAGLVGVFAALVGEVGQRALYAHGRTHFDPPAISIVVWSFGVGILHVLDVVPWGVWIPGTV